MVQKSKRLVRFGAAPDACNGSRSPGFGRQEDLPMDTKSGTEGHGGSTDHQAHEQQLAAALRELLQEVDIGDYRDRQGQALGDTGAFRRARALVDELQIAHEARSPASPSDTPPDYNTWHTGP